jgi:hypothetical protein
LTTGFILKYWPNSNKCLAELLLLVFFCFERTLSETTVSGKFYTSVVKLTNYHVCVRQHSVCCRFGWGNKDVRPGVVLARRLMNSGKSMISSIRDYTVIQYSCFVLELQADIASQHDSSRTHKTRCHHASNVKHCGGTNKSIFHHYVCA